MGLSRNKPAECEPIEVIVSTIHDREEWVEDNCGAPAVLDHKSAIVRVVGCVKDTAGRTLDADSSEEACMTSPPPEPLQLAWGAREIARVLGRTERSVFHALERGDIPGAKKVAGRWCLAIDLFRKSMEDT